MVQFIWTSNTGSDGTYSWNNDTNWEPSGGGVPTSKGDVLFNQTNNGPYTVTLDTAEGAVLTVDDTNVTLLDSVGESGAFSEIQLNAGTFAIDDGYLQVGGANGQNGIIAVANGATIIGDGLVVDTSGLFVTNSSGTSAGVLAFGSGGGVVIAQAGAVSTLEIGAITTGTANFQIAGNAGLEFDDTVQGSTTVTFTGGSTAQGTLIENFQYNLWSDSPTNLSLSVAGMDIGTGNNQLDSIEIAGVDVANAGITLSGGVITVQDAGNGGIDTFTLTGLSAGSYKVESATNGSNTFIWLDSVCFAARTLIRTVDGDRPVEALNPGDLVAVCQNDEISFEPIKWIGYRTLDLTKQPRVRHSAPIRIARGAFGENLPVRDLVVSPDHCLFLDGKLIPAKLLINGMTIRQDLEVRSVTYYHVEMERHSILLAEGVAAESYLDTGNRAFFSNAGLALILHPEFHVNAGLRCWATDACAPLAVSPAAVQPVWRPLADRAIALGFVPPTYATTTEADIHLLADGRRIDTIAVKGGVHSFMVPAGVKSLALASRSVVPNVLVQYLDDPRQIGVAVRGITVRGMAEQVQFGADHPALAHGWHAPERADGAVWRWTKGHGTLPAGVVSGPVVVDVMVSEATTYVIDDAPSEGRLAA